eukprot:4971119-Pyramimonas_sp.AAC.1
MALRGSCPAFGIADVSASCAAAARLRALSMQGRPPPCSSPTSRRSWTALPSVGRTSRCAATRS